MNSALFLSKLVAFQLILEPITRIIHSQLSKDIPYSFLLYSKVTYQPRSYSCKC